MNMYLLKKQTNSYSIIEDVACLLKCTKGSLSIIASEKPALLSGNSFLAQMIKFSIVQNNIRGKSNPRDMKYVKFLSIEWSFVLLVEKNSIFSRLAMDRFYDRYPSIIITVGRQLILPQDNTSKNLKQNYI